MQIQINSDSHIVGSDELSAELEADLQQAFRRYGDQLTRLEVHVGDVNSRKSGERDKRCLIEARMAGMEPIAASEEAATLDMAFHAAVKKLEAALDHALGKLEQRKGRPSFAGDQEI